MTMEFPLLLGLWMPSVETMIICVFAASLPLGFFLWMRGWLGMQREEHPDDIISEQTKADEAHRAHHHQGHGRTKGGSGGHAHA
jgi:hypothetical protein